MSRRLPLPIAVAVLATAALAPSASANGCGVPYDVATNTYTVSTETHLRTLPTCDLTATMTLHSDIALEAETARIKRGGLAVDIPWDPFD